MRRRALLSSTAALSLAALSGCLGDAREVASGDIHGEHGYANLHPADEQYVHGTFPDDSNVRGWVFPEPPADQADVFTDRALQGEFSNDLLWADGNSFVLLFEFRIPRDEAAFYNATGFVEWTGWNRCEIPIRRSGTTYEDEGANSADADELVCTAIHKFTVERGGEPTRATLAVRDRETGEAVGSYSVGEWTNQRSQPSS
ncbi:hypothetical protein ACFQJC_08480 [Haloferax namakaokahaiae]|uniref:Lipoprotein n=1 Tax=Haloferax namakaokahaiae TaxID=1748331 RepID=A0ABD5ZEX6_9EURY